TGNNSYEYLQNAPVHINGGPGKDTLIITGTPIADVFIVTDKFIAGAGRQVLIENNIEKVIVQSAGGDDDIYVLSTNAGAGFETIVRGGSGADRIHIGGDPPPKTVPQPPKKVVTYVDQEFSVPVFTPAFTKVVPLTDLNADSLQAYARQYHNIGGDAAVSVIGINFAPVTYSFNFFGFSFSWSFIQPLIEVDPPPFAFAATGVQDLTGIRGKLTVDGGAGQDSMIVHDAQGAVGTGTLTGSTLTGLGMGTNGVEYLG